MPKAKNIRGTLISFRTTYEIKNKLLKVVEELKLQHNFPNATMSDIIKIALEKTWGIDCYEE